MRGTLLLSLVFCLGIYLTSASLHADDAEDKAVAAIAKLSGTVTRDEKAEGKPVIEVTFTQPLATDAALKELAGFKQLQTLNICPPLSVDSSQIPVTDKGLKELKELRSLKSLNLKHTQVTDRGLKELKALKNLQTLTLGETQVTDAALRTLRKIGLLHALDQTLAPGFMDVKRPSSPEDVMGLHLERTPVTDAGLKELKELTNLEMLFLQNTKVTGAGLKKLKRHKSLRGLCLDDTPVTDAGLKGLKDFKGLQSLELNGTKVTGAGLKALKECTKLQTLDLGHTPVTDAGLKGLRNFKSLQSLWLGRTRITDAGLKGLKELKNLNQLVLEGTQVTDAGLKELKELKNLQKLILWGTRITDAGLKELKDLTSLRMLDLSETKVTGAGVKELQAALSELKIEGAPYPNPAPMTSAPVRAGAGDGYQIKFKTQPDTGKTALVQKQEAMHTHSKLVGLEVKKILEDIEEKRIEFCKYRETILEQSKGQDDPTRLRRVYDKAQLEVGGKTTVLFLQGKTVIIEKKKDGYRYSVDGGQELTGKDAEPLAVEFQPTRGPTPNFNDLVSPDKAARVNDNHDIDPKILLKIYGRMSDGGIKVDFTKAKGSWKLTRAYKKEGWQFGVVEELVELPLLEMSSAPQASPKAAEKLVMRPGAKMTLHAVTDGCIDGSAAITTSKLDMEINGTAMVPSPDNPQFDLILSIETSTKLAIEESPAPQP